MAVVQTFSRSAAPFMLSSWRELLERRRPRDRPAARPDLNVRADSSRRNAELGEAAPKEPALGFVADQGQGLAIGGGRLVEATEAAQQVGARGWQEVIAGERSPGGERV